MVIGVEKFRHGTNLVTVDEFFGSLLNAKEEPESPDYPKDMKLASGKTFLEQFGPRGVLKCKADGKGARPLRTPARRTGADSSPRSHSPKRTSFSNITKSDKRL
jgi:hypothetical protein